MTRDRAAALAGAALLHVGVALALPPRVSGTAARSPGAPLAVALVTARAEARPVMTPAPAPPAPAAARPLTARRRSAPAPVSKDATAPAAAPHAPAVAAPAAPVEEAPVPARRAPGTLARPAYARNPPPDYPASARRRRQEGLVLLGVAVTPEGRAARVALVRSSGVPGLDAAALAAVRGWEFEPARADGVPVACDIEVPVRFQLSN